MLELARSERKVSESFKTRHIRWYLELGLMLRHAIDHGESWELGLEQDPVRDLEAWYELFVHPYSGHVPIDDRARPAYREAFDRPDTGKRWVLFGRDRLRADLRL